MLDNLVKKFLDKPTENNGLDILIHLRCNRLFYIGVVMGKYISNLFPHSVLIKEEYAINMYYVNDFRNSFDIFESILTSRGLNEEISYRVLFNQHFCINHVMNRYIDYDNKKVQSILHRKPADIPLVTLCITTCKRFDLFQVTMNSILNCFDIDKIDKWICVDDNSSEQDRIRMKGLYPFFTFIMKDSKTKGHSKSMNIIKDVVKTPFLLHLEDDWKFFVKRNYIADAMEVLDSNQQIGQCLFNKNYAEIEKDIDVKGGVFQKTTNGFRYYIHEYASTENEKKAWNTKYGNCLSSNYWPHFSLRPSLIRTSIFNKVGYFSDTVGHFEMEYAYRYTHNNYVSVFFEGIYAIHIGRLTSERDDNTKINAYKLNNESQFIKKPLSPIEEVPEVELSDLGLNLKTYVLNLDRRPDRWESFKSKSKCIEFLNYERFSAVDGRILESTSQLQRIFDGNDYNMNVGAVGCAMSYFKMIIELIYSEEHDTFLFLEDDIEFVRNFDIKFMHVCKQLKNLDWDIVFIGHHVRNINDLSYKEDKFPSLEKYDTFKSFNQSIGGTFSFLMSKTGAVKFLEFINKNKMINCIDTMMQKSANELNVYYCSKHLVFSDCYRPDNPTQNIDTDIQTNIQSLSQTLEEKIQNELEFYTKNNIPLKKIENYCDILDILLVEQEDLNIYYKGSNIKTITGLMNSKGLYFYTYEDKVIFINKIPLRRYYNIFKIKDIYSIDDCFIKDI